MHDLRKRARQWLHLSSRTDFKSIVSESKLSDEAMQVLDMKFVHGMSNVQIAMECHCSLEKVNYVIKQSYDKIARLL